MNPVALAAALLAWYGAHAMLDLGKKYYGLNTIVQRGLKPVRARGVHAPGDALGGLTDWSRRAGAPSEAPRRIPPGAACARRRLAPVPPRAATAPTRAASTSRRRPWGALMPGSGASSLQSSRKPKDAHDQWALAVGEPVTI